MGDLSSRGLRFWTGNGEYELSAGAGFTVGSVRPQATMSARHSTAREIGLVVGNIQ